MHSLKRWSGVRASPVTWSKSGSSSSMLSGPQAQGCKRASFCWQSVPAGSMRPSLSSTNSGNGKPAPLTPFKNSSPGRFATNTMSSDPQRNCGRLARSQASSAWCFTGVKPLPRAMRPSAKGLNTKTAGARSLDCGLALRFLSSTLPRSQHGREPSRVGCRPRSGSCSCMCSKRPPAG